MTNPPEQMVPSDAVLTVPNLLTFFRLALLAPMLIFTLGPVRLDLVFVIAFVAMVTDLVDGRVARRTGTITKLGTLLDPLADRLGVAVAAAAIIIHDLMPLWAILLIVVRDVLLIAAGVVMKSRSLDIPPVSRIGKAGSFATSAAAGLFIASAWNGPDHQIGALVIAGWITYAIGVPLYWTAAVGYARAALAGSRTTP